MAQRLKKSRKLRGHVSHGHGRIGKHRKHPGGRGNAGGDNHHRILFDRFHPGYFGKTGMRRFHLKRNRHWCPVVNIDQLHTLLTAEQKASADTPVLNVLDHGYFKVLARGTLSTPMVVKARIFSEQAKSRIEEAGGKCEITAQSNFK